jgi:hypothetical protein
MKTEVAEISPALQGNKNFISTLQELPEEQIRAYRIKKTWKSSLF